MKLVGVNHRDTENTEKNLKYTFFAAAKQPQKMYIKYFFLCVLCASVVLILSACAPATLTANAPAPSATECSACAVEHGTVATAAIPGAATLEFSPTPPPTLPAPTLEAILATLAPTLAPTTDPASNTPGAPTPTDVPRLAPELWQKWPIVPAATARSRQIYQQGLAMGNDPHHFSKVGDCQLINGAFFGIYDKPGAYGLPAGYGRLQETIDWFAGDFNRESMSVRAGFNVASVLSSMWADPQQCKAGETPLDCEFRLNKPSIVLISMETGFVGRTAAVYEKYMRQIIEFAIAHGAAPILATKADNFEGDNSINLVTARLADEYDLPLWNFWRAVQPLPDQGMDMVRNDRFHISVEAWNVRSFTGLEALDSVWRGLKQ